MEEAMVQSIEKMLEKKMSLYHDLHHCFNEERCALINVDVTALWNISSKKDALCLEISHLRQKIITVAAPLIHLEPFDLKLLSSILPRETLGAFNKTVQRIDSLKKDIEGLRRHNMIFMNDSLQFLDDMMAIISRGGRRSNAPMVYNRRCSINKGKSTHILSQEV